MQLNDTIDPVVKPDSDLRKDCLAVYPDHELIESVDCIVVAHADLMMGLEDPRPSIYSAVFVPDTGDTTINCYPLPDEVREGDIPALLSVKLGNHLGCVPNGDCVAGLTLVTLGDHATGSDGQKAEAFRFITQTYDQRCVITFLPVERAANGQIEGYGEPITTAWQTTTETKISRLLFEIWLVYVGDVMNPENLITDIAELIAGRINLPIEDREVDEDLKTPAGHFSGVVDTDVKVEFKNLQIQPPPPGVCQFCACDHEPTHPHNPQSIFYQMAFAQKVGRSPTWADAIAHCEPLIRTSLKIWLKQRNAWEEAEGEPVVNFGEDSAPATTAGAEADKYQEVAEEVSRETLITTPGARALFVLCEEKGLPTTKAYILNLIRQGAARGESPFTIAGAAAIAIAEVAASQIGDMPPLPEDSVIERGDIVRVKPPDEFKYINSVQSLYTGEAGTVKSVNDMGVVIVKPTMPQSGTHAADGIEYHWDNLTLISKAQPKREQAKGFG